MHVKRREKKHQYQCNVAIAARFQPIVDEFSPLHAILFFICPFFFFFRMSFLVAIAVATDHFVYRSNMILMKEYIFFFCQFPSYVCHCQTSNCFILLDNYISKWKLHTSTSRIFSLHECSSFCCNMNSENYHLLIKKCINSCWNNSINVFMEWVREEKKSPSQAVIFFVLFMHFCTQKSAAICRNCHLGMQRVDAHWLISRISAIQLMFLLKIFHSICVF